MLAGRCKICNHAERGELERMYLTGEPQKLIVERFQVSKGSILRHRKHVVYIAGAPELIEARASSGKTQNSIAAELGMPRQRFTDLLRAKQDWRLAWEKGSAQHEQYLSDLLERCITEKLNPVPALFALKARYGWLEAQYQERNLPTTPHVMIVLPGAMGADAYMSQVKTKKLPAQRALPPQEGP